MVKSFRINTLLLILSVAVTAKAAPLLKSMPEPGSDFYDFNVERVYTDGNGQPIALRLIHPQTCTPLTLLQGFAIPQFLINLDTPVTTDQGLPHSLEHLLAGKGTKGRFWNLLRQMRLSHTTAATNFDSTYYGFDSPLGMNYFAEHLHALLDALLKPDFTDEEAVHEFYHMGVEKDPTTQSLSLTEKGSVYTEVQSSFGYWDYWKMMHALVLGPTHPWAFDSGGVPNAMRTVTPIDIRAYHLLHYHLGPNANLYFSVGPETNLQRPLQIISEQLNLFAGNSVGGKCNVKLSEKRLTQYPIAPNPQAAIQIAPFPAKSLADPGQLNLAWNPTRIDSLRSLYMLSLFLQVLVKDTQGPLNLGDVKLDDKTILSATSVSAQVYSGHSARWPFPVISLGGIEGNKLSASTAQILRKKIVERLEYIAQLPASSKELQQLRISALASIRERQRQEKIWLKRWPNLGQYEGFRDWKDRLDMLDLLTEFSVPLDHSKIWDTIAREVKLQPNPWAKLIEEFGMTRAPHVIVAVPSVKVLQQENEDHNRRLRQETERLKKVFHVARGPGADQAALEAQYKIEQRFQQHNQEIASRVPPLQFVKHPPLTADPQAQFTRGQFETGNDYHVNFYPDLPQHEILFRFDLQSLPKDLYPNIAVLTRILHRIGLQEGTRFTSVLDLQNAIEEKGADVSEWIDADWRHRNYAWVLRASGANVENLKSSLDFLNRMLRFPAIDLHNIAFVTEQIREQVTANDSIFQGGNVQWIQDPAQAFRAQDDLLYLAANSQFTQSHWTDRILWRLHNPVAAPTLKNIDQLVERVLENPKVAHSVSEWETRIQLLQNEDLGGELKAYWLKNLKLMPEDQIPVRLQQLWKEVREDLAYGQGHALQDILRTKNILFNALGLQIEANTTKKDWKTLRTLVESYIDKFPKLAFVKRTQFSAVPNRINTQNLKQLPILRNILSRDASIQNAFPFYLGFVNADAVSGNVVISADGPTLDQPDLAADFLATKVFSGSGPHSFYMKTWEQGLAHANGILSSADDGEISYYADRSTDITALLQLIDQQAQRSKDIHDVNLGEYALACSFSVERLTMDPGYRGALLAADFRNGNTPEKRKTFAEALLRLRHQGDFTDNVLAAAQSSIAPVLLNAGAVTEKKNAHSIFFFIAPENQLRPLDKQIPYLHRVWVSDYWLDWPTAAGTGAEK